MSSEAPWPSFVDELMIPYEQCRSILELGNKRTKGVAWKEYFESLQIRHFSIDLNGQNGAMQLDLTEDLVIGQFDLVTNFGTTEHVENQEMVWRNIHRACGHTLVSSTPKPGHWKNHGRFYPTLAFYVAFADLNKYRIERLYMHSSYTDKDLIQVRMVKRHFVPYTHPSEDLIHVNKTGEHVGVSFT